MRYSSDATQQGKVSHKKTHAVTMEPGWIALKHRGTARSIILYAMLPVLKLPPTVKKKKRASLLKKWLYHDCMRLIHQALLEAGRSGARALDPWGKRQLVFPLLWNAALDTPEQKTAALVFDSQNAEMPIIRHLGSTADITNPSANKRAPVRTEAHMKQLVTEALQTLQEVRR